MSRSRREIANNNGDMMTIMLMTMTVMTNYDDHCDDDAADHDDALSCLVNG